RGISRSSTPFERSCRLAAGCTTLTTWSCEQTRTWVWRWPSTWCEGRADESRGPTFPVRRNAAVPVPRGFEREVEPAADVREATDRVQGKRCPDGPPLRETPRPGGGVFVPKHRRGDRPLRICRAPRSVTPRL